MNNADQQALNSAIGRMLSDARVTAQTLPQCPQINLWLVEPEAMRRPFSADEIRNIQDNPAYWAFCWASGQVLAREILANPQWVAGKKVMDFGAGSGVVAVACVLAGARPVLAGGTDSGRLLASAASARLIGLDYAQHGYLFAFDRPLDL